MNRKKLWRSSPDRSTAVVQYNPKNSPPVDSCILSLEWGNERNAGRTSRVSEVNEITGSPLCAKQRHFTARLSSKTNLSARQILCKSYGETWARPRFGIWRPRRAQGLESCLSGLLAKTALTQRTAAVSKTSRSKVRAAAAGRRRYSRALTSAFVNQTDRESLHSSS
jgi:hypothetical protein